MKYIIAYKIVIAEGIIGPFTTTLAIHKIWTAQMSKINLALVHNSTGN